MDRQTDRQIDEQTDSVLLCSNHRERQYSTYIVFCGIFYFNTFFPNAFIMSEETEKSRTVERSGG